MMIKYFFIIIFLIQCTTVTDRMLDHAYDGNINALSKALGEGWEPDEKGKKGFTALMTAAEGNKADTLKFLIEKGASLDIRNNFGETALTKAASKGNIAIVKILVEAGAARDLKNNRGYTPFHLACEKKNLEVAGYLQSQGVDINSQTFSQNDFVKYLQFLEDTTIEKYPKEGEFTPLHTAACAKDFQTVKFLLEAGANPNLKNSSGETPIYCAIRSRSPEIVKLLINFKANPTEKNIYGETPILIAKQVRNKEILKHIQEKN